MQVTTIQGIVKNGQIHLSEDVHLPEMTEVFVIVPKFEQRKARIMSPRLKDKEKLKDFKQKNRILDINTEAVSTISSINKLENEINKLKQIFTSWAPVPNDGGLALKTEILLQTWNSTPITPITQQSDLENDKIKHGG